MNLDEIIKSRPDKSDIGASAIWKLRHIYKICDKIKPNLIIESGTYSGNSLWLFRKQNPNAALHSYDITYHYLKWKDKTITYHNYDIESDKGKYSPNENSVIYFDDHQNQEKRLQWAYETGFKHIIFDDNVPYSHLKFFGKPPTPTISMLNHDNKIPHYVDYFKILDYDGSNPQGRNGGQNYLTYLKII